MSNRNKTPTTKTIVVKTVGGQKEAQTLQIAPGTTTNDILTSLGLPAGYQLSDAKAPEVIFNPTDDAYARLNDNSLCYASARVEAGY